MIRKLGLILKFITSKTGKQTMATHMLPNISKSKVSQTMKFVQLIEYNRIIFPEILQKLDLFLFFKIALFEVKASGEHLNFNIFW